MGFTFPCLDNPRCILLPYFVLQLTLLCLCLIISTVTLTTDKETLERHIKAHCGYTIKCENGELPSGTFTSVDRVQRWLTVSTISGSVFFFTNVFTSFVSASATEEEAPLDANAGIGLPMWTGTATSHIS